MNNTLPGKPGSVLFALHVLIAASKPVSSRHSRGGFHPAAVRFQLAVEDTVLPGKNADAFSE